MKKLPALIISIFLLSVVFTSSAFADSSAVLSGPSNGSGVSLPITINTNGTDDNSFEVVVSFSEAVNSVSENIVGSAACTLDISNEYHQTSSTITLACGIPNGFNGSGLLGTINANLGGEAKFWISSATFLENDGHGTKDTVDFDTTPLVINLGGDTGTPSPTPTPSPSPSGSSTPTPTKKSGTPTPTLSITATPKVNATALTVSPPGSYNGKPTTLPKVTTANQPSLVVVSQPPYKVTPTPSETPGEIIITPTPPQSVQTLVEGYFTNTVAALLFIIPIIALLIMVGFMSLRMFQVTRRKQREIELLFEHELGELAALESKMDLINEKGDQGKKAFEEEFKRTKDQILKELKPEYIGSAGDKKPKDTKSPKDTGNTGQNL